MTGTTIRIDDGAVLAGLQRLAEAGRKPAAALKNIGEAMIEATRDRIVAEKGPDGVAWAPLHPLYAEGKKGPGKLRESGELYRQIVYQLAGDSALDWGTDRKHARVHQFGATIRPVDAKALVFTLAGQKIFAASVTVPARPFLGVSDEDRQVILEIIEDHLGAAFERPA